MDPNDIRLESVNWQHGMLLTPDHFLRQERYFDSSLLWMLRYGTNAFGLVGGGPRLPEAERGAVKYDPVVSVDEDDETLRISITQARGLTSAGVIVDIDPDHPLHREFPKSELEGVSETLVYILTDPQQKSAADGEADEANPQMQSARRHAYGIRLAIHAEDVPYALPVARLRKAQTGVFYEKDAAYIPPCTTMVAHSELTAGWRRAVEQAETLLERYTRLYRAMQEYLRLMRDRDIETELDFETMQFVGRLTTTLQDSLYDILDPLQPTERVFGALRRFFHSAAIFLELSPPVRHYYDQLIETGETEFVALLEQQRQLRAIRRRWEISDDLGLELRHAAGRFSALERLELALEGKYVDFRISPTLEAMNFIFDRGGKQLYKLEAKHSHLQGFEEELTIHFAKLQLEGRDRYRLILAGHDNAVFEPGQKITAEIRINEGSGFRREPIHLTSECQSAEQRNFEFDFEGADVAVIQDLRVSIPEATPIRSALLFKRHRFFRGAPEAASQPAPIAQPVQPQPGQAAGEPGMSRRERSSRVAPSQFTESRPAGERQPPPFRRVEPAEPSQAPPWEQGRGDKDSRRDDEPPRPRRRSRLE